MIIDFVTFNSSNVFKNILIIVFNDFINIINNSNKRILRINVHYYALKETELI